MTEVIGIGGAFFDTLVATDGYPREDTKFQCSSAKNQCGGPCATALVAMSKMGISAAYMGTLGDDLSGDFIRGKLQHYGVDISHVRKVPGTTSSSFIMCNTRNVSRTCICSMGTAQAPEREDLHEETIKKARYLHLDGSHLEAAVEAARIARQYGVLVSLDAGTVFEGIERLLPLADILIPAEEFALKITGAAEATEAAEILQRKYKPQILIITQGILGGFLWKEHQEFRYPAFPVEAVDSNGAGDVFHGAFLAAQLRGMDVMEAAKFASAASALKCTRVGAQEGSPGFEEVQVFLKEREAGGNNPSVTE